MNDPVVYNPTDLEDAHLPKIYAFSNGVTGGIVHGVALAEDGTVLGDHGCSSESFIPFDLGVMPGHREDRHTDQYQKHYPDGYRMEFVPSDEIDEHVGLQRSFDLARESFYKDGEG